MIQELISTIEEEINILSRIKDKLPLNEVGKFNFVATKIIQRLQDNKSINLLFTGTLGSGKSSLINSVLNEEVLATSVTPSWIVNELSWGDKTDCIFFDDLLVKESKSVELHGIHELNGYENQVSKAVVFFQWKNLNKSLRIIELPDINLFTDQKVSDVFNDFLISSDVVVMVLSSEALLSATEYQFIQETLINGSCHQNILFVCNKIDRIRFDETEKIKNYALNKLSILQENQILFFL